MRFRLVCLLALVAACGTGEGLGVDGGLVETEPVGQGSEARGPLVVNEIAARPETGPDWIELYNRSEEALDLCDFFLSDSLDRLDHYHHLGGAPPPQECSPQLLDAGAYLLIYADDDVAAGPEHAPFKLGAADEAHVISVRGEALDSVIFLHPADAGGLSLSRQPNGEGLFWIGASSQGQANPEETL